MQKSDLIDALCEVLLQAREDHAEVAYLRTENERLTKQFNKALDLNIRSAGNGLRDTLLMGLALSGESGREIALKMIDKEPQ